MLDITCLTKIHTMALAATLASGYQRLNWTLGYTVPENYANFEDTDNQGSGWKDVIIAPLGGTALLFNETASRGVVLTGHEADRLVVALAEIEPSGGVVIAAESRGRPDLRVVSERRNRQILRQLTGARDSSWTSRVLAATDIRGMTETVQGEIVRAKEKRAPVILFPYGPKPLIFAAAFELVRAYPEASWFVYPIPARYDADYTEGIAETFWLVPAGRAGQAGA
jgi:hypothetical protein